MIWLIHMSEYLECGGFFHVLHAMLYIEHNIVQSVLYFNIHVVMMYVLYTQTWITFVYYTSNIFSSFQSVIQREFPLLICTVLKPSF